MASALFFSDVHLSEPASVKAQLVLRFLQEKGTQHDRIYILGDLFDSWPSTSKFLLQRFSNVLGELKRLTSAGHQVHYVEGNHDFHLGEYFEKELGIQVYPDAIEETWDGKRVFLTHGDLGNPRDVGYRMLRTTLRSMPISAALKLTPGEWLYQLGVKGSHLSRKLQKRRAASDFHQAKVRQTYRKTAESLFAKGFDYVLMGHTHLPDDVSTVINNRHCRYINTGDWISHFTYVEFDGRQFYTRTHPVRNS